MDFAVELRRLVTQVEQGLEVHLPPAATRPARLHEAMRYSLEAGGKRLRPVLLLATAELFGRGDDRALPAAVAIECLHTYSLIHDDLPCMDDDDLRRGRPTAHRAFDEATALLAGDALLTHAFALLATHYAGDPALANALTRELADAAGSRRLIGGQMEDLLSEKKSDATAEELEFIHLNKTAAMIEASLVMGGLIGLAARSALASGPTAAENEVPSGTRALPAVSAAQAPPAAPGTRAPRPPGLTDATDETPALPAELAVLRTVGRHLGLAFQIIDDVLDATADSATLGKTAGKDAKADKTTFVKLHGLKASRRFAREHTQDARTALASLQRDHRFVDALIESLVSRAK